MADSPEVTICIPHWQVERYMRICLRAIRKYSEKYRLQVIVVDNGSHDHSLAYLRSLDWVRLIERPDEAHDNSPMNVFTAWDRGLEEATGDYFLTMHSDVFAKSQDWLDPLLEAIRSDSQVVGTGAWKLELELENPLYSFQKHLLGYLGGRIKGLFTDRKKVSEWTTGHYPRDYYALYRTQALRDHQLTFRPIFRQGGGYSIARQIWNAGYSVKMIPVPVMAKGVYHIAHGTAGISPDASLKRKRQQQKVVRRVEDFFNSSWVAELERDSSLDS